MIRVDELLPSLFVHRGDRIFNLATFNNFVVVKRTRDVETGNEVPMPFVGGLEKSPEMSVFKAMFGTGRKHFYAKMANETQKEVVSEDTYWVDGLFGAHFSCTETDGSGQLRSAQIPLFCYQKIEDAQRQLLRICKTLDMMMLPRVCPSCYGGMSDGVVQDGRSKKVQQGIRVESGSLIDLD